MELAPRAFKTYQALDADEKARVRAALVRLAAQVPAPADRGAKTVKSIHGARDDFWRLRVGDYRVMYDVMREDEVILVLGIIARRDLETWLRRR